jgi:hypothetical protein
MTASSFHAQLLLRDPPERHRLHGKAAIDGLGRLFSGLPLGGFSQQAHALAELPSQTSVGAQEASQAWFELVSAHALDFHADAGKQGSRWDLACIDALETWRLLREQCQGENTSWGVNGVGFAAAIQQDQEELDVHGLVFGGKKKVKKLLLSDWRVAIARRGRLRAGQEANALASQWRKGDLPSLAMALGALWAVAIVGEVAGVSSLEIGGLSGKDDILVARWH